MFVALVVQHAMRMRCSILSSVAFPALQYFPTLCHRGQPKMDGPPAWGLGEGLTTHHENVSLLRNIHRQSLGPGLLLWYEVKKEMGRACSAYGGGERHVKGFSGET
jgi:hypothetical protein